MRGNRGRDTNVTPERKGEKEKNDANRRNQPDGISGNVERKDPQTEDVTTEKIVFKSTWARQMTQLSLEKQLQAATEAAARVEGKDKTVKSKENTKKQLKMGDSLDRHEEMDWPWETSDTEWEGTQDKWKKNQEKKERTRKKREDKVRKAATVGKCTIGIGPIKKESFDYFYKVTGDYGEAKKLAAAEFLSAYLKYDDEDMIDLDITDTKISAKNDDILYIVMDSPEKIKNIRRRIADVQNPTIKTREYIPPSFFKRYTALSRFAADLRGKMGNLKTQIRFTDIDIRLFTKIKGTEDPFEEMPMEEVELTEKLPKVEHEIQWRRREDQPSWRRVSPDGRKVQLKSLANDKFQTDGRSEGGADKMSRNISTTSTDGPMKKKNKKINAESSSSDSSSSSDEAESPAGGKSKGSGTDEIDEPMHVL